VVDPFLDPGLLDDELVRNLRRLDPCWSPQLEFLVDSSTTQAVVTGDLSGSGRASVVAVHLESKLLEER
jgi:hypothetical protein